jgi:hypothetical protein
MKASLCLVTGFVFLLTLGASLIGCSEDESLTRSRVTITRIAGVNDDVDLSAGVFESDVLDAGEDGIPATGDDVYYEDVVLVTVENEPSSAQLGLQPGGPFGSITLESYRVEYRIDGEQMDSITGGLHLVVPTGGNAQARIPLVTALAKTQPPLSALATQTDELLGTVRITLTGTEQDSGDEIVATGEIAVHFANWADR